jgi:hypothetical protein
MLDVARVNARTVGEIQAERGSLGQALGSREFARELVRELVTPHIQRRMQMRGIQTYVKLKARVSDPYFDPHGSALI